MRRGGSLATPKGIVLRLALSMAVACAIAGSVFGAMPNADAATGGASPDTTAVVDTGDAIEDSETDGVFRTGPEPTGRADPPTGQRVIDTLVWVWILLCVAGAAAWVIHHLRRAPDGPDGAGG